MSARARGRAAADPKAVVREYFDGEVDDYLGAYSAAGARGEIFRDRQRLVLNLVRSPVGIVLDVGSGPGVLTAPLLARGARCVLADLSLGMLRRARSLSSTSALAPPPQREVADVEVLPHPDATFDTVLCVGVLQYLGNPEPALTELARVTREGGQVIVTFPNRDSLLNRAHIGMVALVRLATACLGRLGLPTRPHRSRLTFRTDIPNVPFGLRDIETRAACRGLHLETVVYHSVHFPFSVPGCRPIIDVWNRLANEASRRAGGSRLGREIIVRFRRETR